MWTGARARGAGSARPGSARPRLLTPRPPPPPPPSLPRRYVVDSLIAETEQGRALREIRLLDTSFDEFSFVAEMREQFIPVLARAFFRLDHPTLAAHCRPTAMAQMRAVAAAREAEGLEHDGTILQVSKVELLKAQQMEDAKGGTTPLLLVSAQVQYIHAVRDKTVRLAWALERARLSPPSPPSPSPFFLAFEGGSVPLEWRNRSKFWRHSEHPAAGALHLF